MNETFPYDVALSFAGEDRAKVEPIANLLKARGVNVFYDTFEQSALWGKDLTIHLSELYFKQARFFIPFLSQHYGKKDWPGHELKSALARTLQDKKEYILPIRLDKTEIPGILPTVGHIDFTKFTAEQIVDLILAKIDNAKDSQTMPTRAQTRIETFGSIPIPKVKKTFSQREKDLFAQESFLYISKYFEEALNRLKTSDSDIETDFNSIHRNKFICKIYVKGEIGNSCKIWFGGSAHSGSENINYVSGKKIEIDNDNSINDTLSISEDGHELILKPGFGFSLRNQTDAPRTKEGAAQSLWERFIEPLSHKRPNY